MGELSHAAAAYERALAANVESGDEDDEDADEDGAADETAARRRLPAVLKHERNAMFWRWAKLPVE